MQMFADEKCYLLSTNLLPTFLTSYADIIYLGLSEYSESYQILIFYSLLIQLEQFLIILTENSMLYRILRENTEIIIFISLISQYLSYVISQSVSCFNIYHDISKLYTVFHCPDTGLLNCCVLITHECLFVSYRK